LNKILILVITFSLILVGCSKDDPISSSLTFTEGTYNVTGGTMYDNVACSGTGSTGMCLIDPTAMTEADCPSGMCMDGSGAAAADCADGMWMTGMCIDGSGAAAADCADGMWMTIGWNSLIDLMSNFSIVFGSDGVFTNPDGEIGTYAVDGTTVTITDDGEIITGTLNADGTLTVDFSDAAGCFDMYDEEVEAADEDACNTASGEWEEGSCAEMILTLSNQ